MNGIGKANARQASMKSPTTSVAISSVLLSASGIQSPKLPLNYDRQRFGKPRQQGDDMSNAAIDRKSLIDFTRTHHDTSVSLTHTKLKTSGQLAQSKRRNSKEFAQSNGLVDCSVTVQLGRPESQDSFLDCDCWGIEFG